MGEDKFSIREIKESELYILEIMLYEAIFQPVESEPLPRTVIKTPEIGAYIDEFHTKKDDYLMLLKLNHVEDKFDI